MRLYNQGFRMGVKGNWPYPGGLLSPSPTAISSTAKLRGDAILGAQCGSIRCRKYRIMCTFSKSLSSLRVDFTRAETWRLRGKPGSGRTGNRNQVLDKTGMVQSPVSRGVQFCNSDSPKPKLTISGYRGPSDSQKSLGKPRGGKL